VVLESSVKPSLGIKCALHWSTLSSLTSYSSSWFSGSGIFCQTKPAWLDVFKNHLLTSVYSIVGTNCRMMSPRQKSEWHRSWNSRGRHRHRQFNFKSDGPFIQAALIIYSPRNWSIFFSEYVLYHFISVWWNLCSTKLIWIVLLSLNVQTIVLVHTILLWFYYRMSYRLIGHILLANLCAGSRVTR